MRSRETGKNQGNLEAAVKGNSHGGLAGMKLTLTNCDYLHDTDSNIYRVILYKNQLYTEAAQPTGTVKSYEYIEKLLTIIVES